MKDQNYKRKIYSISNWKTELEVVDRHVKSCETPFPLRKGTLKQN